MVKSGEVQYTASSIKQNLSESEELLGDSSRPRNISIPSADTCGFLTVVQQPIFVALKKFDTGFI
jgi:hypothetical protein